MTTAPVRRHRPGGGTWDRPRPDDDAEVTRILAGIGPVRAVARVLAAVRGRHAVTDDTPPQHRASIHVDAAALAAFGLTTGQQTGSHRQLAELLDAHRRTTTIGGGDA